MEVLVVFAFIIAILGAGIVFIVPDIERKVKIFFILGVIYFFLGWFILYACLLSTCWPLFGWFGFFLLGFWCVTCLVVGFITDSWNPCNWFPLAYIIVIIIVAVSGAEVFNSSKYAGLIGTITDKTQKHWSQDIQPLDQTRIRLVPEKLALSLAKTTLSQDGATLGSQFPLSVNHVTLQKIGKDYWYLIPLDFKGWAVWTDADYVPGYVKISAVDPYAKPILVTGKKFKYMPGAFFEDNLERRLYKKYHNKVLKDYSFEEDDNGNVYWVISVCHPTVRYWGQVVEGVIIFDPCSGDEKFVSISDLDKDPQYAWIDRVMPQEIIADYIDYWGDLKGGALNSIWGHLNLLKAETPTMNYSADGTCVIVTPVTSSNDKDQAMTGLMYTDARTGKSTYYATSGGATEQAVIDAVNSATSYKNWHADSQMVYENVYGKLSALVPILGANGNYQGLAIVENENKRVAMGITPQEALTEFQKMLMSSGGQITTENSKDLAEFTGKIARLGWNISATGKQYYIFFAEFRHSFTLSSNIQSELELTREGDEVYVRFINSDQASVPVMGFKNITLGLQSSKKEKSVEAQMSERKADNQTKSDVQDFKKSLNGMSDAEIKKIIDKQHQPN